MIRTILAALIVTAAPLASAQALSAKDMKRCQAMAATFAPKQAEIKKLTEKRDGLAEIVEAKGEVWDDAETLRLASAGHADTADAAKAEYTDAKTELQNTEIALQSLVKQFNLDVADFNQTCATGK